MLGAPTIGQSAELTARVGADRAIHLGGEGSGSGVLVFSTPAMIDLMEHTARRVLAGFMEDGEESVGSRVSVDHLAPTPVGATVRAEATVTGVDRRTVDFELTAHDEQQTIGRGSHRRAVVPLEKIAAGLPRPDEAKGVVPPMSVEPNRGSLPPLSALTVEQSGGLATVTLNRPAKLNAVDTTMTADWEKVVAWLAGHEEVRVVIVTGAGRAFSAGDDVKEVGTLTADEATRLSHRQARMYLAFEAIPQFVIGAVNGPALGGGCCCAVACDYRLASTNATFGMPEVHLGWPPGYGVPQLTALVGKARALEMCCTGRTVSAREAEEWGLAQRVVPANRIHEEAHALAQQLLQTPSAALKETKRLIHMDEGPHTKTAYLADTEAYIRCLQSEDAREGIAAFTQKRTPHFIGR